MHVPVQVSGRSSWLVAWHICDETHQKGLAELITTGIVCPSRPTGAKALPRHLTDSAFVPAVTARPPAIATGSTAADRAMLFYTHISG